MNYSSKEKKIIDSIEISRNKLSKERKQLNRILDWIKPLIYLLLIIIFRNSDYILYVCIYLFILIVVQGLLYKKDQIIMSQIIIKQKEAIQ